MKYLVNSYVVMLLIIVTTGFGNPSLAFEQKPFELVVELHRKIIFLMDSNSSNAVARERDILLRAIYMWLKENKLEVMEEAALSEPAKGRAIVEQLNQFSQSENSRAADALAFIDLVDTILYQHNETPFLKTTQLQFLKRLEKQLSIIQQSYSKNLAEITAKMQVRGFELEPWKNYIDFLNARYDRDDIHRQFNKVESELAEPATRGAESKKDAKKLVWGFGVPQKTVVLTFDDGPHYRNTGKVLDTLKEHNVKGYFFAVGKNIGTINAGKAKLDKKAKVLQRALNEGHSLANHSFSHSVMTKLDSSRQKQELQNTNALLKTISGSDNIDFRPPYGSKNDALLKISSDLGMRAVMWNVDSMDWADPVPDSIVERVMKRLNKDKRGILLFHDIHKQTVQALPKLLTELDKQGYKVVTIEGKPFDIDKSSIKSSKDKVIDKPSPVKSQLYGNSWALVVGVNKYQYWPQLSYAVNDAKGVAEVLRKQYGFKSENIFELYNEDATREKIAEFLSDTLADPSRVKPNDRVFIFYAGHGMTRTLPSGRNLGYIIPVNAELNKFSSNSISMTHLQDFSDMIPAKHVYFVMDSCYSGIALTRGGGLSGGSKYLNEISSRRARQILTAGGADQEVADGGPQGHSIFTWSLLQGLRGDADLDKNRIITASELGAFIAPKVSEISQQTPVFGNLVGSEGGDFLFELSPATSNAAAKQSLSEAEKLRNKLLQIEKDNEALKQQLAALQNQRGQSKQASVEAKTNGKPLNQEISSMSPSKRRSKSDEYHRKGLDLYKAKKYKPALKSMRKAINYNPSNVGVVNDYGYVLYRDKQFSKALGWLEKTIEMDAERIPVYVNIADTLANLDRVSEAIPYYEYYLELYPDSPIKERIDIFLSNHK